MKRTEPQHIGKVIERMLEMSGAGSKIDAHSATLAWPEVTSPAIAKATTACFMRDGVMHVFIAVAALKEELSFYRPMLIERINNHLGARVVKGLVIH